MRFNAIVVASAVAFMLSPVVFEPLAAQAPAAKAPAHYSVETTLVGKLIDDPAAAEILKRLIPAVWANEQFQSLGRDLTLKAIQQYEPDSLSDANLAKIQAEFDKIPAKS